MPQSPAARLPGCTHWSYQLQRLSWERVEASIVDVAVIDFATDGADRTTFTPGQLERMRDRPGGGTTRMLAYLSVGAAEPWRSYWSDAWQRTRPAWMARAQGEWSHTQLVHYWDPGWQRVLTEGAQAPLSTILAAGFDGVLLDGVDVFEQFRGRGRTSAAAEMIALVAHISARARQSKPDFLVVPMNGEELLRAPGYRASISAIAREEILYRGDFVGGQLRPVANSKEVVDLILDDLQMARTAGLPVLGVEYLCDHAEDAPLIAPAARRLRKAGIVPTFAPRNLDQPCTLPV